MINAEDFKFYLLKILSKNLDYEVGKVINLACIGIMVEVYRGMLDVGKLHWLMHTFMNHRLEQQNGTCQL